MVGIIIALIGMMTQSLQAEELSVKGSDTLVNVVQVLAEEYRSETGATVNVGGGGSGTGIKAIMRKSSRGGCHIANSSRAIKKKEKKRAQKAGVDLTEIIIARDGLCVIVNEKNPINQLSYEQVQSIYRGKVKKWNQIKKHPTFSSRRNNKITVLGRQPSSGTYVYFRDEVVRGDYSFSMLQLAGNAQILETVSNDVSAIGYVGIGYLRKAPKNIKAVALSKGEGEFCHPFKTPEKYPLVRPLFQYISSQLSVDIKKKVTNFMSFILSEKGQEIVVREGFIKISPTDQKQNQERLSRL